MLGRGKKDFILGYSSLFLTAIEGFPMGHIEAIANVNETLLVESLLEGPLGEDLKLLAGDSGFESHRVFMPSKPRRWLPSSPGGR